MNLPYYQIDNEVFQTAADLSVLLDWDESKAFHGVAKVVKWMVARCPDDAPPSAHDVVEGAAAAKLIARAAGWTGDAEAFVDACAEISPPFLERVAGGVRVRGLKRYDATWGKSHAELWKQWKDNHESGSEPDGDGSGPKPGRKRDGTGPEPARKMKTETKSEMETKTDDQTQNLLSPTPLKEPGPSADTLASGREKTFWEWCQEKRRARRLKPEVREPAAYDDWLVKYEYEYGRDRLERCFEAFLADPWSHARNPDGKPRNATVALFISPGCFADKVVATRTTLCVVGSESSRVHTAADASGVA